MAWVAGPSCEAKAKKPAPKKAEPKKEEKKEKKEDKEEKKASLAWPWSDGFPGSLLSLLSLLSTENLVSCSVHLVIFPEAPAKAKVKETKEKAWSRSAGALGSLLDDQ